VVAVSLKNRKGYRVRLLYTFLNQDDEVVSVQTYTILRYQNLAPQTG
jgi:hypothetical protein